MLSLRLTVEQCIQQRLHLTLQLTGGWTESIFPEVEKWLQQSSDHQNALLYISKKNNGWQERYRSVIDFLVAQIIPGERQRLFHYYHTNVVEDKMRFHTTMGQRNFYAAQMVVALEIAYQHFQQKRAASWTSIAELTRLMAA